MRCEGGEDFSLFTRRHFAKVKGAPELGRHLVKFFWRDLEVTMRLLKAQMSFTRLCWRELVSTCAARAHALPTSDSHGERMLSASATERALASFMTSDGTQIGERSHLDWWAPLAVVLAPYFGELFLAESRVELDRAASLMSRSAASNV